MLLARFYLKLLQFAQQFQQHFFGVFPILREFHDAAELALRIEKQAEQQVPQQQNWGLAHSLIPSFVEHKHAFATKNVLQVLLHNAVAQRCQLLEIWCFLEKHDRQAAFIKLCELARFAEVLYTVQHKYEAADKAAVLLNGKLMHSGYDPEALLSSPSGPMLLGVVNELTADKAFEHSLMTLLSKEFTWDLVRKCLPIWDLPPMLQQIVDQLLVNIILDEANENNPTTTTNNNTNTNTNTSNNGLADVMRLMQTSSSSQPTETKQEDEQLKNLVGMFPSLANPPAASTQKSTLTSSSLSSILPKNMDDIGSIMAALAPMMSSGKSNQEEQKIQFERADQLSLNASSHFRQGGPIALRQFLEYVQESRQLMIMLPDLPPFMRNEQTLTPSPPPLPPQPVHCAPSVHVEQLENQIAELQKQLQNARVGTTSPPTTASFDMTSIASLLECAFSSDQQPAIKKKKKKLHIPKSESNKEEKLRNKKTKTPKTKDSKELKEGNGCADVKN